MVDGMKVFVNSKFTMKNEVPQEYLFKCMDSKLICRMMPFDQVLDNRDILFVEDGAFTVVERSPLGEKLLFLMNKGDVIVNVFGENAGKRDIEIRPVGTTLVSILRYQKLMQLREEQGEAFVLYLRVFEDVISSQIKLKSIFLRERARGRYEAMIKEYSHLFKHFRLKDIAGFLGMSPVSLSRLRRQT
jgi:hypothetical protein